MIAPEYCDHDDTEPVDVDYPDGPVTVARVCLECHAQLEPGWGCPVCEWNHVEERRLCDVRARVHHMLVRPCGEHA